MRLRYTFDGITYLFQVIVPVHFLCTGLVHDPRIICRIGGYVQTGMTDLRPVTVDKRVTHDDKQPPFEIRVLVVTFFVKHCLEQGILQQIFRLLPVRCQFVRETEQFVLYAKQLFFKIEFLHRLCRFPVPEVPVKGRTALRTGKACPALHHSRYGII